MYIALICTASNLGAVGVKHPCTITGTVKNALIARAMTMRSEMERTGHGPYAIYVGELTHEVSIPVQYEMIEIGK